MLDVALYVLLDELVQGLEFGEDLDAPAAVEEGGFDDPEVLALGVEKMFVKFGEFR